LTWFGILPVWSPIGKTPDIAWTLSAIHAWSAWILFALFALHFAAVIFHHVLRRDETLYRIL
jgi:cytochrome b561